MQGTGGPRAHVNHHRLLLYFRGSRALKVMLWCTGIASAKQSTSRCAGTWIDGCVRLDDVPQRQPAGPRRLQLAAQPRDDALRQRVVQAEGVADGIHLRSNIVITSYAEHSLSLLHLMQGTQPMYGHCYAAIASRNARMLNEEHAQGFIVARHLLADEQVGAGAQRDGLELIHLLARHVQLQHRHVLVRVPAHHLPAACAN